MQLFAQQFQQLSNTFHTASTSRPVVIRKLSTKLQNLKRVTELISVPTLKKQAVAGAIHGGGALRPPNVDQAKPDTRIIEPFFRFLGLFFLKVPKTQYTSFFLRMDADDKNYRRVFYFCFYEILVDSRISRRF